MLDGFVTWPDVEEAQVLGNSATQLDDLIELINGNE